MLSNAHLPRIAVIVGSNRRDSINRKLAQALIRLGAGKFDASFARIDDLPMYNQDNEGNLPSEVVRFKNELARADGVLIVTPEHDRSIPAALKNAIDWGARPWGKNSWTGKPAFITGTSPGAIGSALAQQHLRSVMTGLGMILLGGEAYVTFKPNLIDEHARSATTTLRNFSGILSTALRTWSHAWRRQRRPRRRRFAESWSVTLRCERSEPRRATAQAVQHPSRPAHRSQVYAGCACYGAGTSG
jgi:chromate reductase, NAD(P)H dehydrogenase (quinone)